MAESITSVETARDPVDGVVDHARRRLKERVGNAVRIHAAGRLVVVRGGHQLRVRELVQAGVAVHDVRTGAESLGFVVEAETLPRGCDPRVWAVLTVNRTPSRRSERPVPGDADVLVAPPRRANARQLVSVCAREAAGEGVSLRVAPVPRPDHVDLVMRAKGGAGSDWLGLGQAWATVHRLAERSGWVAELDLPQGLRAAKGTGPAEAKVRIHRTYVLFPPARGAGRAVGELSER